MDVIEKICAASKIFPFFHSLSPLEKKLNVIQQGGEEDEDFLAEKLLHDEFHLWMLRCFSFRITTYNQAWLEADARYLSIYFACM